MLVFCHSQTFRQLININICTRRWSWKRYLISNFMVESLSFFNGRGSTSQARSRHFIEVWPEFAPLSQMAMITSKSFMAVQINGLVLLWSNWRCSGVLVANFEEFSSPFSTINPFYITGLFLHRRFSDVFRGYRKRPVAWNGLL